MNNETCKGNQIVEPLEALARLADERAKELCDRDLGCEPYHQFWTMARYVLPGGSTPRGGAFLEEEFACAEGDKDHLKILVAGSADAGVTVVVANAGLRAGKSVEVTVVDRCATPLAQIEALPGHPSVQIRTEQCSLQAITGSQFDAAVSHNVMLFNSDQQRQSIYDGVSTALRPGGKLLSIETLCETISEKSPEAIERKVKEFSEALQEKGEPAEEVQRLSDVARRFWSLQTRVEPYPESSLRRHVETAQLELEKLEYRIDTVAHSPRWVSSAQRDKARAYIVAKKPI